jgi:ABC-type bacteriocin/lantibiotic exporter with double-glycine peptidase domain
MPAMEVRKRAVNVAFGIAWIAVAALFIFKIGGWFAWIGYAMVAYYVLGRLFVLLVRSRTLREALERAQRVDS